MTSRAVPPRWRPRTATRWAPAARVVVAIVLAGVVLVGCSPDPVGGPTPAPSPAPTAAAEPSRLVIGIDDLGAGFNPHLISDLSPATTALSTLVLPSVFRPDDSGVLRLDDTIATSATVSSTDPFTVTYELNLGASWSTNTPIAAEDFVYLWERMRAEPGVVDAAGYRLITDVRSRAGGKAVDVVFAQPYPAWRELFAGLLPAHLLKDAPGSWVGLTANGLPASGGPFRIDAVDRARGEVVLNRNDLYWDTPAVPDRLVLRRVEETGVASGLASGEVDVMLTGAGAQVRGALAGLSPAPNQQLAPRPTIVGLGMRADGGPMSDPAARTGLAALIDRDALRQAVAPDALAVDAFGAAPSDPGSGPADPGYAPSAPADAATRLDPALAAAQFARAGWTQDADGRWTVAGEPVTLVLAAAADRPDDLAVARVLAAQLQAGGVAVRLVAPQAVDLFGAETVPDIAPSATPIPSRPGTPTATAPTGSAPPSPTVTGAAPTTAPASPTGPEPTTTAGSTTTTAAPSDGRVEPDLLVLPHAVGGDTGSELASSYGCPEPTALVPDPPRGPTGFCAPGLQPLLDDLVSPQPQPATAAAVERVLWAQLPVLPLFQPVDLVLSRPGVGGSGGPLVTGPLTGAAGWRPPDR